MNRSLPLHRESLRSERIHAAERLLAGAWCAAIVQRKSAGTPVVTDDVFRTIEHDQPAVPASIRNEVSASRLGCATDRTIDQRTPIFYASLTGIDGAGGSSLRRAKSTT
jgi:hypothetical protein